MINSAKLCTPCRLVSDFIISPTNFQRYDLLTKGSCMPFQSVYKGKNSKTNEDCFIKTFSLNICQQHCQQPNKQQSSTTKECAVDSCSIYKTFIKELQILVALYDHPAVISIIGHSSFLTNEPTLVLQYSQTDLEEALKVSANPNMKNNSNSKTLPNNDNSSNKPILTSTDKMKIIYGICSVVSSLHQDGITLTNNIFHPSHIYLNNQNEPLMSFNFFPQKLVQTINRNQIDQIDQNNNQNSANNTKQDIISTKFLDEMKNNKYMAPDDEEKTMMSDVYSLGMLIMTISNINYKDNNQIDTTNSSILNESFNCMILRCLSKNPLERPTASEIVSYLRNLEEKPYLDHIHSNLNNKNNTTNNNDKETFFVFKDVDLNEFKKYVEKIEKFYGPQKVNNINLYNHLLRTKSNNFPNSNHSDSANNILFSENILYKSQFKVLKTMKSSNPIVKVQLYEDSVTKEKYVFKIFKEEADLVQQRNYIREIEVLSRVRHPSICRMYGIDMLTVRGHLKHGIMLEFLEKWKLESMMSNDDPKQQQRALTITDKMIILFGIASAMSHLHQLNFVHRNIRPSSIYFDKENHPVLAGFTFSKHFNGAIKNGDRSTNIKERNSKAPLNEVSVKDNKNCVNNENNSDSSKVSVNNTNIKDKSIKNKSESECSKEGSNNCEHCDKGHEILCSEFNSSIKSDDPLYKAPESHQANKSLSNPDRLDVYSFGMLAFYLITGKDVYSEMTNKIKRNKLLKEGTLPKFDFPESVCPKSLTNFLEKCCSKEPQNRPTANDVVAYLLRPENRLIGIDNIIFSSYLDYCHPLSFRRTISFAIEDNSSNKSSNSGNNGLPIFNQKNSHFVSSKNKNLFHSISILKSKNYKLISDSIVEESDYEYDPEKWDYRGSYASVYLAKDKKEPFRTVALKRYDKKIKIDKEFQRSLFREIEILASLNHPVIIKLLGHNFVNQSSDALPFIVLEYMPNGTIEEHLEKHNHEILTPTVRMKTMFAIASALEYLHSIPIVHRDLKPDNIMLDSDMNPRLLDFNQSKLTESISGPLNASIRPGAALYHAPELNIGGTFTSSVDIFSLGIIMYQLYTDERPFKDSNTIGEVEARYKKGERPIFPSKIIIDKNKNNINSMSTNSESNTNDDLVNLIKRCWAQDPTERPSASEVAWILRTTDSLLEGTNVQEYEEYVKNIDAQFEPGDFDVKQKEGIFSKNIKKQCQFKLLKTLKTSPNWQLTLRQRKMGDKAKILFKELISDKMIDKTRFLREIEVLSKINHPAIVQLRGCDLLRIVGNLKPAFYIEFKEKGNLNDMILKYSHSNRSTKNPNNENDNKTNDKNGITTNNDNKKESCSSNDNKENSENGDCFDNTKKTIMLIGISSALALLHSKSYIVRDLKPTRIVFGEKCEPFLSGLGATKHIINDSFFNSMPYQDPTFSAPELLRTAAGSRPSTFSIDVYSFGMIAYFAISEKLPFKGLSIKLTTNKVIQNGNIKDIKRENTNENTKTNENDNINANTNDNTKEKTRENPNLNENMNTNENLNSDSNKNENKIENKIVDFSPFVEKGKITKELAELLQMCVSRNPEDRPTSSTLANLLFDRNDLWLPKCDEDEVNTYRMKIAPFQTFSSRINLSNSNLSLTNSSNFSSSSLELSSSSSLNRTNNSKRNKLSSNVNLGENSKSCGQKEIEFNKYADKLPTQEKTDDPASWFASKEISKEIQVQCPTTPNSGPRSPLNRITRTFNDTRFDNTKNINDNDNRYNNNDNNNNNNNNNYNSNNNNNVYNEINNREDNTNNNNTSNNIYLNDNFKSNNINFNNYDNDRTNISESQHQFLSSPKSPQPPESKSSPLYLGVVTTKNTNTGTTCAVGIIGGLRSNLSPVVKKINSMIRPPPLDLKASRRMTDHVSRPNTSGILSPITPPPDGGKYKPKIVMQARMSKRSHVSMNIHKPLSPALPDIPGNQL